MLGIVLMLTVDWWYINMESVSERQFRCFNHDSRRIRPVCAVSKSRGVPEQIGYPVYTLKMTWDKTAPKSELGLLGWRTKWRWKCTGTLLPRVKRSSKVLVEGRPESGWEQQTRGLMGLYVPDRQVTLGKGSRHSCGWQGADEGTR